jgi:hypothetical protein
MAELCYLEYGVDTDQINVAHRDLDRSGFRLRSKNPKDSVRFYSQGSAVLMLRVMPNQPFGLVGIGLAGSAEEICNINGIEDVDTGFVVGSDGDRRITVIETHQVNQLIEKNFVVQRHDDQKGAGLGFFSGIVLPTSNNDTKSTWTQLGFDINKRGKWSETAISAKRKFTVMFADVERPLIVADTDVIFDTVSNFLMAGIETLTTQHLPKSFDHPNAAKARAYECTVFGNRESYSVEKFYPRALGNADLLVRQRKQYLHIPEENLEIHYAAIRN